MTWFEVGLKFGLGLLAAVALAGLVIVVLVACVSAIRGEEEERMVEVRGWEGTN